MSLFPQIPGRRLIRALERAGFIVLRQAGGHAILRHKTDLSRRVVVPVHGSHPIKPGTLRAILKGTGLSPESLRELL